MRSTALVPLSASLLLAPACKEETDDTAPDTTEGDTDTDSDTDTDTDTDADGDTDADTDADTDCTAVALEAANAMVGSYEGSWEMFGLDPDDEPVSSMSWTDVATATDPVGEATRAYVSDPDVRVIPHYGEMEQSWIEGVYVNGDCSLGVAFMEMEGVTTEMPQIEDGHYQYQSEVTENDLWFFDNVTSDNLVSGYHVTDKLVTYPDDIETHDITRTTHLEYTAADVTVVVDFTSMTGTHQKTE